MKTARLELAFLTALVLIACALGAPSSPSSATPPPTPAQSIFDAGVTAYGFFPSPPEISLASVMNHFRAMSEYGDFVIFQNAIPWQDFVAGIDGESQKRTDIRNQMTLARQNKLDAIWVVDPLNGLNRREFMGLPAGWQPSFANPNVRAAFTNYTLWLVHEFRPRYLGLASEINTYADAHPEDFPHFVELYRQVYALVKAQSPETRVFVTFQWEDLNNLFASANEGRPRFATNWEQIEVFEPQLDLWAISSYPFVVFRAGAEIPPDYYAPLVTRTTKPLAVAEGGYPSRQTGPFPGKPQDQVDYLNAIHDQMGKRLTFWVYLLLNDFNAESYANFMRQQGVNANDINTLGMFANVGLREANGTPKAALNVWNSFRKAQVK